MEKNIKQVSSLETIFSYEKAHTIDTVTVLGGERFSYQIVINPPKSYRFEISVDTPDLNNAVTLYKVREAVVDLPHAGHDPNSDLLTREECLIPDILVPLSKEDNKLTLKENKTQVVWVRVDIPSDMPSGDYYVNVRFAPLKGHVWDAVYEKELCVTMKLEVLPCNIPEKSLIYSQWFYNDCIADYYNLPVYSQEHWDMIEAYLKTAVDTGINMILTPVITPALDVAKGIYRTNVQLVDIKVKAGKYVFDFSKLEKWIDICLKCGIKYFEIAHLFSQWGLKYTPGIVADVDGKKEYIFGWNIESTSPKYAEFLQQFLPVLVEILKKKGIYENVFFHISDEPNEDSLEIYQYASELIKPLIGSAKILDALSNYEFYKRGMLDVPITDTIYMDEFLDKNIKDQWVYYAEDLKGVSIRNISSPPYRNRIIGLQLYKYNIKGFLHWGYNFYNSALSYHKINPYLTTSGDRTFMSGGPFTVYPDVKGALLSTRALVFYEALQDLSVCSLLEKYIGKDKVINIIEQEANMDITFWNYPRNPEFLPCLRYQLINELKKHL